MQAPIDYAYPAAIALNMDGTVMPVSTADLTALIREAPSVRVRIDTMTNTALWSISPDTNNHAWTFTTAAYDSTSQELFAAYGRKLATYGTN